MTSATFKGIDPPPLLASARAWLTWSYMPNGDKKSRKIPRYANGTPRVQHGTAEDRAQLVTFSEAKAAAAKRGAGLGIALLGEGVTALDFDNATEADVLPLVAGTYAEVSPSGHGVRAFYQGDLGNRKADPKTGPFGVETFSSTGFVTFTGRPLPSCEMVGATDVVAPVPEPVKAYLVQRLEREVLAEPRPTAEVVMFPEPPLGLSWAQLDTLLAVLPNEDVPYEGSGLSWLGVGMALHHETEGSHEGLELWDQWSRDSSKYSSREFLEARWLSFGRRTGNPVTMRSLVKIANDKGVRVLSPAADVEEFKNIEADDKPAARFQLQSALEFTSRPPPGWIIKGVLPRAEVVMLYGPSGSGKSFFALDMVGAIAQGIDWRGLRVKRGRVVYIAAEGASGFRNRLVAYAQGQGLDLADLDLFVINAAPNLILKPDALELAKAIGRCDVLVVDTFAQVTPGANENAGEDMGLALRHCRGLHVATGATVLLVHHSGKDVDKGARGWSGIKGAMDAELEVQRLPNGRVVRVSKQKDGEDGGEFGFELSQLQIGTDEDGDPVTSCVVVEAQPPVRNAKGKALGAIERVVLAVVMEMGKAQNAGIELKAVLDQAVEQMDKPDKGVRDTRRQRATRALEALCQGDDAPFWLEDDCITIL